MTRKTSKQFKFVAFILSLVMLMTAAPLSAYADEGDNVIPDVTDEMPSGEQATEQAAPTVPDPAATLTAADVPEFIALTDLTTRGTVRRLYEEEADLSTILFENNDGTRTLYMYGVPVKYVAPDGTTRDKSTAISTLSGLQSLWNGTTLTPDAVTTLAQNASIGRMDIDIAADALTLMGTRLGTAYGSELTLSDMAYASLDSDIRSLYPTGAIDGIVLNYGDYSIRTIPVGGNQIVLGNEASIVETTSLTDNDTRTRVRYNGAFGTGTVLQYTPTTMGVKEEVILTSNVGKNEFSFLIETGGLTIAEENGSYYFFDPETQTTVARLGEVIAYDSNGQIARGATEVVTIREGQQYGVTISVSEEFLASAAYPVSVDPTISFNADYQRIQFRAIYDNTAVEGIANSWELDFGTHTRNGIEYCGRVYTRIRDFMSLMEDYTIMYGHQVNSLKLYFPGSVGYEVVPEMRAYASLLNWTTETVYGNFAYSSFADNEWECFDYDNIETDSDYPFIDVTILTQDGWLTNAVDSDKGILVMLENESSNTYRVWYLDVHMVLDYIPAIAIPQEQVVMQVDDTKNVQYETISDDITAVVTSSNSNVATATVSGSNVVITALEPGIADIRVHVNSTTGSYKTIKVCVAPDEDTLLTNAVYMIRNVETGDYLAADGNTVELDVEDKMDGRQLWYLEWTDAGYMLCSMGAKVPTAEGVKEAYLSSDLSLTEHGSPWLIHTAEDDSYYLTSLYPDSENSDDSEEIEEALAKTLTLTSGYNVAMHSYSEDGMWAFEKIALNKFNNYYGGEYECGIDLSGKLHIQIVFDSIDNLYALYVNDSNVSDFDEDGYISKNDVFAPLSIWEDYSNNIEIYLPGENVKTAIPLFTVYVTVASFPDWTKGGETNFKDRDGDYIDDFLDEAYGAKIKLNVGNNSVLFSDYEALKKTLIHEMGHVLMLAHPIEETDVMVADDEEDKRSAYDDYNSIVGVMNWYDPADSDNLAVTMPSKHDIINLRNKFGG